jgi:hypothetical protein
MLLGRAKGHLASPTLDKDFMEGPILLKFPRSPRLPAVLSLTALEESVLRCFDYQ